MERFLDSPEYGSYLKSFPHSKISYRDDTTYLCSIKARVCGEPSNLHVRVQDILLFTEQRIKYKDIQEAISNSSLWICNHPSISEEAGHVLQDPSNQQVLPCPQCAMDCTLFLVHPEMDYEPSENFKIWIRPTDHKHWVLVVTRWIDLGDGKSPFQVALNYPLKWRDVPINTNIGPRSSQDFNEQPSNHSSLEELADDNIAKAWRHI